MPEPAVATTPSERRPTPDRIVEGEHVHVGRFDRPFRVVNLEEAPAAHLLSRLRGGRLAGVERAWRKMRLKQWHYASVATPRLFLGAVVFDAGYVGLGFAYVVDRKTGHAREFSRKAPLARGVTIAPSSTDGTSRFAAPGFGEIEFRNEAATGRRQLRIELQGLKADLEMREVAGEAEPMISVNQPAPGRWVYTHKAYALPAGGTIECGDWTETTKLGDALAGIDWNRGYRANQTRWNWAAAAGRDTRGRPVGFTFSTTPGDSALWLGGRAVDLGEVRFAYDPAQILLPWRLRDPDGLVDLEFQPLGERVEDLNLGVIVSKFHQPYGTFRGTLRSRSGEKFDVSDVFGVTEEHFARW